MQTCPEAGLTDSQQCHAICSSGSCSCSSVEVFGSLYSCTCTGQTGIVFQCGEEGSLVSTNDDDFFGSLDDNFFGTGDDDFFNNFNPNMDPVDLYRHMLTALFGERCSSAINRAINQDMVTCFSEQAASQFEGDDDLDITGVNPQNLTGAALDELCGNSCLATSLRAVSILHDANCLTPAASLDPSADDNLFAMDDDDGFALVDFEEIGELGDTLELMCARGNGVRCGNLLPVLESAMATSSPTQQDCQLIADAGFCLGTLANHVDQFVDDDGFDASLFVSSLNDACVDQGVSGIAQAASATEAPANLASSSASTTVASLVAAVAMVAAAALF